jgi:hypothetical protein
MLISLFAVAALSGAAVSDLNDPDVVVTTARADQFVPLNAVAPAAVDAPSVSSQEITPHGLTTAEQIDMWIGQRDADAKPFDDDRSADLWAPVDDRKMHGEVSASIGTGDYTAWSGRVSIPVGETGRVDLSYSQSKNSPYGYGYGYGYPGFGPDALHYGPGYRGARDPFFLGSGVIYPGAYPGRSQQFGFSFDSNTDRERDSKRSKAD